MDANRDVEITVMRRESTRDQIRDYILKGILDGTLPPGSRLREIELAKALGTSQAPVREALRELEGSNGAVRAETCDNCKSYLKIVYQEKDPYVDPVADDLATLALDILVDEAGFERSGPNLLLLS